MSASPAERRPRHQRGFVLYMDLLGFREMLVGAKGAASSEVDFREIVTVWFRVLEESLGPAMDSGEIQIANLFSDSVFAYARRSEPLFQAALDVMRSLMRLRAAAGPMMARGAI